MIHGADVRAVQQCTNQRAKPRPSYADGTYGPATLLRRKFPGSQREHIHVDVIVLPAYPVPLCLPTAVPVPGRSDSHA